MTDQQPSFTYRDAGVDIDAGERAVQLMKTHVKRTFTPAVLAELGTFGAMYALDVAGMTQPVLISSADGVGTKLKFAFSTGRHTTVGQDLVNHCVNDILVQGAKALFFMDYFAVGKLDPLVAAQVVEGLSVACVEQGCSLIGGETAEMPDVYKKDEYDLVGTIIGELENGRVITGQKIKAGDVVLGLASTGLHTNGYTLARKIFEGNKIPYTKYVKELKTTPAKALLKIHRAYYKSVYPMIQKFFPAVHGIAHITGGGFFDNIIRILPEGVTCVVNKKSWKPPAIFRYLQKKGNVEEHEMYRVFNMGIGLVIAVDRKKASAIKKFLTAKKERVYEIGVMVKGEKKVVVG